LLAGRYRAYSEHNCRREDSQARGDEGGEKAIMVQEVRRSCIHMTSTFLLHFNM